MYVSNYRYSIRFGKVILIHIKILSKIVKVEMMWPPFIVLVLKEY